MAKAYVFDREWRPGNRVVPRSAPAGPRAGQLLVAVRAAGVNPADWKRRAGSRPPGVAPVQLPAVLGGEVAGVVEQVGADVTGFAVGDVVFGNPVTGGYAEYTLLPAEVTAHKPPELSFTDAATLPIAAATAYDGVQQLGLPAARRC